MNVRGVPTCARPAGTVVSPCAIPGPWPSPRVHPWGLAQGKALGGDAKPEHRARLWHCWLCPQRAVKARFALVRWRLELCHRPGTAALVGAPWAPPCLETS